NPRKPTRVASFDDDQDVSAVAFSPDGHTLATGSRSSPSEKPGGRLRLWDVTNPRKPTRLAPVPHAQDVTAIPLSPDRHTPVPTTTSRDTPGGRLRPSRLPYQRNLPPPPRAASIPDDQAVSAVAFSPDGRTLATGSGSYDSEKPGGRLRLWDVTNPGKPIRLAPVPDDQDVTAVAFSPDGHTLATTSTSSDPEKPGGRLRLWDVTNPGKPIRLAP